MSVSTSPLQERFALAFPYGLNENQYPDIGECSAGYNFELSPNQSALVSRKPVDLEGTATNAGEITGIMQLVKRTAAETTLVVAGTAVYQWGAGGDLSVFTSKGSVTAGGLQRDTYWSLDEFIVITDVNKINVVGKWDGTTFAALTTGLASALYAKYAIVKDGRMWLFNITYGTTALPHMILVSAFENAQSYDTTQRSVSGTFATGLEAFYILTPDLKPINGATIFKNTLIVSTQGGSLFALSGNAPNGTDPYRITTFNDGSPAIGNEAVAQIGNDVVFMRQGGRVNLLSATQEFGDAQTDELTKWIPNTVKDLTDAIVCYDKSTQKVYFFVANKVLVLFKDLLQMDRYHILQNKSPWSVYTTQDPTRFNTKAVKYMRIPGTTNYRVFFGDSAGRVLELDGEQVGDSGAYNVDVSRTSAHLSPDFINPWPFTQKNINCRLVYRRIAEVECDISLDWDDEYSTTESAIFLHGPATDAAYPPIYWGGAWYFGGNYYWNQGFTLIGRVAGINFSPGGKGPGCYLTVFLSTDQVFKIDKIEIE